LQTILGMEAPTDKAADKPAAQARFTTTAP